jgi:methylthioribulose-1-phosphate dehydratase
MSSTAILSDETLGLRRDLIAAGERFYRNGWLFGTSGNLSGRCENTLVISASGCDKGALSEIDFVELSTEGELLRAVDGRRPSAETSIHLALYDCMPSINAILHVHTPASTKLKATGKYPSEVVLSDLEMLKGWGLWHEGAEGRLPIFENHADVPRIAHDTRTFYTSERDVPAFIIEGHGITAWGPTVADARRHVEVTEFFCQLKDS